MGCLTTGMLESFHMQALLRRLPAAASLCACLRQDVFIYIICQEAAELPKVRLVTGLSVTETGV